MAEGVKCGKKMERGEHWRGERRGGRIGWSGRKRETQGTHQPVGSEREMEAAVCFQRVDDRLVSYRLDSAIDGDRDRPQEPEGSDGPETDGFCWAEVGRAKRAKRAWS